MFVSFLLARAITVNLNEPKFHADIVAIGLEELIDLNASNIVKARFSCVFFVLLLYFFKFLLVIVISKIAT